MLKRIRSIAHHAICKIMRVVQFFHRYLITPLIGARCRFEPSCSEYCCQGGRKARAFSWNYSQHDASSPL